MSLLLITDTTCLIALDRVNLLDLLPRFTRISLHRPLLSQSSVGVRLGYARSL